MAEIRDEQADLVAAYRLEYDLAVEQGNQRKAARVAAILLADHGIEVTAPVERAIPTDDLETRPADPRSTKRTRTKASKATDSK
ncbi:MAG: hypothetical protein HZY75_13330 [Nocardioidaceae bacterium]|nr:MAG: hypothetical protein HZY75_13330 [Nocardioidaceae bacterium]